MGIEECRCEKLNCEIRSVQMNIMVSDFVIIVRKFGCGYDCS